MVERKRLFLFIWVIMIIYAAFLSPKDTGDTKQLVMDILKLHLSNVNSLVVMLFYMVGMWSIVYAAIILIRDYKNKIIPWLTIIASFFLGSYAIIPYITLKKDKSIIYSRSKISSFLSSKKLGIFLCLTYLILISYGIIKADWSGFIQLWLSSKFVNVMTMDFLVLTFLFPLILKEDMEGREYNDKAMYSIFSLVPLLGACVYLVVRPPIKFKQMGRVKGGVIIDNRNKY